MKAIITGINGQDGYYLAGLLREMGIAVTGTGRQPDNNIVDFADFHTVSNLIRELKPDYFFHLAASSTTAHEALFHNHQTIVTGTLNVLEAVRLYAPETRVFIAGSGLQFENHDKPVRETNLFEGRDPYSVCRIQSVYTARYFRLLGLKVYVGYLFNHDSPLRKGTHLSKRIADLAKRVAAGSNEKMAIGDIAAIKEYGFAGDIVKGIWALVNQENIFEANIATGKGYAVSDWLDLCFGLIAYDWKDFITGNPGYVSPYRSLVADTARMQSLGWKPETSISDLAAMMMK